MNPLQTSSWKPLFELKAQQQAETAGSIAQAPNTQSSQGSLFTPSSETAGSIASSSSAPSFSSGSIMA